MVLAKVQMDMATMFGGFTQVKAKGGFKAQKHVGRLGILCNFIMLENVIEVQSFAKNLDKYADFIELALFVKKELNQESVKIVVNNEMFLI